MSDSKSLPLAAWKKEAAQLTQEKYVLYGQMHSLCDEVKEVETIRRSVELIINTVEPTHQQTKSLDTEL